MNVFLDENAFKPNKAHDTDAGWDIKSPVDCILFARSRVVIDTGVHVEIPKGYVGMIKSKSGLNVLHGISSEGVIDVGYTGAIKVALYNNSDEDYEIAKGDKITQLVVIPIIDDEMVCVPSLDMFGDSERGNGGFGSTGKQ